MDIRSSRTCRQILDCLAEVGAADDLDGFCSRVLERIPDLMPVEPSAVSFAMKATGESYIRGAISFPQDWKDRYNNYYWSLTPVYPVPDWAATMMVVTDWRDYRHTEFVTDFLFPQDIGFSTCLYFSTPGRRPYAFAFLLNRSRRGRQLNESELSILRCLQPHLFNLYNIHVKLANLAPRQLYAAELALDCRRLSKREAEVARLLCQRLSAPEIASRLLISARTVESHIANIYEKLRVGNRRELMMKLLGEPHDSGKTPMPAQS